MQLEIMTPWVRARRVLIAGLSYRMYIFCHTIDRPKRSTRAAQKSKGNCE